MGYTKDDLTEAKRQIDSTLHKLREALKTLEAKENSRRYQSQITLTKRRINDGVRQNQLAGERSGIWKNF